MHECPKQMQKSWTPRDVFEVECPGCGQAMEFFKDEERRKCRKCGRMVVNPKRQEAAE